MRRRPAGRQRAGRRSVEVLSEQRRRLRGAGEQRLEQRRAPVAFTTDFQCDLDRRAGCERRADREHEVSLVDLRLARADLLVFACGPQYRYTRRGRRQRGFYIVHAVRVQWIGHVVPETNLQLDGVSRIDEAVAAALGHRDAVDIERRRSRFVLTLFLTLTVFIVIVATPVVQPLEHDVGHRHAR